MNKKRRLLLLKGLVWLLGLAPVVWLLWRGITDRLGANPIEEVLHRLGDTALIFLLVVLSITPLRRLTGWNILAPLRRPVGLFAFFYLTMHFLWYAVLDQTLDFEFHHRRRSRAPVYSGWIHGLVAADPPGHHVDQGMDPETQKELAKAPSFGVRGDRFGGAAFLLAGEGGYVLADCGYDRAGCPGCSYGFGGGGSEQGIRCRGRSERQRGLHTQVRVIA